MNFMELYATSSQLTKKKKKVSPAKATCPHFFLSKQQNTILQPTLNFLQFINYGKQPIRPLSERTCPSILFPYLHDNFTFTVILHLLSQSY